MTTHTQILKIIASLNATAAELKTLAATNVADSGAEGVFRKKAEEISTVVETLEERRRVMLKEESQYREDTTGSREAEKDEEPRDQ